MTQILTSIPYHTCYTPRTEVSSKGLTRLISTGFESRTRRNPYGIKGARDFEEGVFIWQHTISGAGKLNFNGEEYTVTQGHSMLLTSPNNFSYEISPTSNHWKFIYLTIKGDHALSLASQAAQKLGVTPYFADDSLVVQSALQIITSRSNKNFPNPYYESTQSYAFLMTLLSTTLESERNLDSYLLEQVRQFTLTNIEKPITVAELAHILGWERSYFSRKFHAVAGIAPVEYILKTKLENAAYMLRCSPLTIKEIAIQSSYTNVSYFCKLFKTHYGKTPKQFRLEATANTVINS